MKTEQQTQPTTLYPVKQSRYEGKEIHVYAQNFSIADNWFADNVMQGKVDFNLLEFDLENENATFIEKVMDIESDTPLISVGEKTPLYDKLTKGYDPSTGCYVFSMVDEYTRETTVEATSPEEALQKAMDGKVSFPQEETMNHKVYVCSEDERAIIDGKVVKYWEEDALTEKLKQAFPDGMTVTLEKESLKNLMEYSHFDEELEWVTLNGIVGKDGQMPGAYGKLEAKMELKPDDYGLVFACDKTYWSEELSDIGWDAEVNATSMLLAFEEDMNNIRVQTALNEEVLEHLLIEGKPYHEVMDLVQRYQMQEDELIFYFDNEFLNKQPDWKREMAKQQTREVINKFFVEKAAPAFIQQKKMFNETQEQAAKENGYDNATEWQNDVNWSKNPSQVLADKMRNTSERWRELYAPHEKKCNEVFDKLEQLKASEQRAFIERFDRRAEQAISSVKVIQRGVGEMAIRCMIDGVQQMGRTLGRAHQQVFLEGSVKNIKEIAAQYFKNDIIDSMSQSRERGLKR